MRMSSAQNGSGGPSDYLEEIVVLNQDFLISIQNALKKSPKDCLAPLAMDYLQFVYTIMRNSKGSKFPTLPLNEPVDFQTVALFFQTMSEQMSKVNDKTVAPVGFGAKSSSAASSSSTLQSFGLGSNFNSGNSFPGSSSSNLPSSTTFNHFPTTSLASTGSESNSTFKFTAGGGQNSTVSSMTQPTSSFGNTLQSSAKSSGFTQPTTTTITFGSPALNTSPTKPSSSIFGSSMGQTTSSAPPVPLTFGFSAQSSTQAKGEESAINGNSVKVEKDDSDDDTPPKPDFVPVVETDALYTKRIKLFAMVDKKYTDRGVGNLFVKRLSNEKCQLVIRADNSLGKILLNVVLNSSIVLEFKPPNNILASVPGQDDKPVTYIIRVKTSDEANELLQTLEKYK